MTSLHVLDLFSGVGGFSLGLERIGRFAIAADILQRNGTLVDIKGSAKC